MEARILEFVMILAAILVVSARGAHNTTQQACTSLLGPKVPVPNLTPTLCGTTRYCTKVLGSYCTRRSFQQTHKGARMACHKASAAPSASGKPRGNRKHAGASSSNSRLPGPVDHPNTH